MPNLGPFEYSLGLPYTLELQLFTQQAVLQRDVSVPDAYGADSSPNWHPLSTVPCRLYWARSAGARMAQREYPTPQRLAPVTDGGIAMPLGTDVTEADQITEILDLDGNLYIAGIFEVIAVVAQETHLELGVYRPHLGA